jgi:RNA-binding protein Musashi
MGNGQMGPPMNMQSNMMQGWGQQQNWGQQQGYGGYAGASSANAYQGYVLLPSSTPFYRD